MTSQLYLTTQINLTDVILNERSHIKEYILHDSVSLTSPLHFLIYKVLKTRKTQLWCSRLHMLSVGTLKKSKEVTLMEVRALVTLWEREGPWGRGAQGFLAEAALCLPTWVFFLSSFVRLYIGILCIFLCFIFHN